MTKELRSARHCALIKLVVELRNTLGMNSREPSPRKLKSIKDLWRLEVGGASTQIFLEFPKLAKALQMTRQEFIEAAFVREE